MIYVFLANGFETIEALTPVDFLRRCGLEVKTVSVSGGVVQSSHKIGVCADIGIDEVKLDENLEAVILPGGGQGSENLDGCAGVQRAIDFAYNSGKLVCAICAAPFILGKKGILNGRNATCFPGFENELTGAKLSEEYVVADGNVITAKGAGVSWEFSAKIAEKLVEKEKSDSILRAIQWKK